MSCRNRKATIRRLLGLFRGLPYSKPSVQPRPKTRGDNQYNPPTLFRPNGKRRLAGYAVPSKGIRQARAPAEQKVKSEKLLKPAGATCPGDPWFACMSSSQTNNLAHLLNDFARGTEVAWTKHAHAHAFIASRPSLQR